MPTKDDAVANPPKGGPQEQASTNDDNANNVLADSPWVVAVSAHGQVGVRSRHTSEADAKAAAAAARAALPDTTEVHVLRENDTKNGLPALVAKVEADADKP